MTTLLERMTEISTLITAAPLVYSNEYDLQAGIQRALEQAGHTSTQEVELGSRQDRIDILIQNIDFAIGIEVKVDGALSQVIRQLDRYASSTLIDGLLLVTTRSKHHRIPFQLNDKPVRLVSLVGAGL